MAFKTVATYDPNYEVFMIPHEVDRYEYPIDPGTRAKLIELIERGELPRIRGSEVEFSATEQSLVITIYWNSRAVAQEWADWAIVNSPGTPDSRIRSIEVVEY